MLFIGDFSGMSTVTNSSQNGPTCPICGKMCKSTVGVNIHVGKAHSWFRGDKFANISNLPDRSLSSTSQISPPTILIATSINEDTDSSPPDIIDTATDSPTQERENRLLNISESNPTALQLATQEELELIGTQIESLHPAIIYYKLRKHNITKRNYTYKNKSDPQEKIS